MLTELAARRLIPIAMEIFNTHMTTPNQVWIRMQSMRCRELCCTHARSTIWAIRRR